ncbi:MAG: hypothetical protein KAZ87_06205 [Spirochaetes bacterium]|nr:hypothetical protein [Spirochaetota bacterium]
MKNILGIFVIACSLIVCSKADSKDEVTKDFLITKEWLWLDNNLEKGSPIKLKFKKNDVFSSFEENDGNLTAISGRYSLANNKLTLVYQRYSLHTVILPEDESKMGPDYTVVLTFINDRLNKKKYFIDEEKKIFILCN